MPEDKVNMDDLFGAEEERQEEGAAAPVVPQQQQRKPAAPSQAEQLKKQYQEVNQRLMHALGHDYEGYKLDTDQQGNPHFGKKGYAKYEQDKLLRDDLRDRINEAKESEREERTSAQASLERAKQLIKKVFEDEIRFVNKDHQQEVQSLYLQSLRTINWGDPNLRTDVAKEGMLSMVFGWAAQKVRREKQAAGKAPSGQQIDASHEDADAEEGKTETNDFGFEKGSVGFDITQQYAERLRQRQGGPLGRRGDK